MSGEGEVKVEIVALMTECIVYESYINETGCLNEILKKISLLFPQSFCLLY
jgi:hypothetical protein